ncbi:MAG: tetratricopeptide repeat protein [Bacteroidia bacterium]|nr:tetratricopeptide repeat protein [Bacteroidia bacterium]
MRFKSVFSIVICVMAVSACSFKSQRDEDFDYIKKLEKQIYSPKAVKMDAKLANELVNAYDDFCKKYPQDSLSPKFLFKAGETSMSINMGTQAIGYFNKFMNQYPDHKRTPHCLFLIAFIYETQLQNLQLAKENYTEFINKYPGHEFVKDAKASIELLGKSPEEVIKGFEEKQNQNRDAEERQLQKK